MSAPAPTPAAAAGDAYRVRVQVTRPGDEAAEPFSGHAIVEAIHPQGVPFVWNDDLRQQATSVDGFDG
jgi:hypothetical protein